MNRHRFFVSLCLGLFFIFQLSVFNFAQAQTLTLDSCLALARRNNADIRVSQLDVARARAVKSQAFTHFFPQLQLNGLGYVAARPMISFALEDIRSNDMRDLLEAIYDVFSQETDVSDRLELMKHGFSASVVASQPVYAGGRIVNGNRLASLGEEAAVLQAEIRMRDVLEEVESTYYLVVGLKEKEATVEAALTLIDSVERVAASALANGLATRADMLQINLRRNEIEARRQQLASGIRMSCRLLCSQIGIEYSDSIAFGGDSNFKVEFRISNFKIQNYQRIPVRKVVCFRLMSSRRSCLRRWLSAKPCPSLPSSALAITAMPCATMPRPMPWRVSA